MDKKEYFYQKSKFYYDMYKKNKLVKKVCAFIEKDDKYLVLVKNNTAFNIGGSVDKGEKTKDAVVREVFEESNGVVESAKYITKSYYTMNWEFECENFPNKRVEFFYLCKLKNENISINGLEGEFDDGTKLEWHTLEELENLKLNKKELKLMKERL